jgi:CIC family chloride channel protein
MGALVSGATLAPLTGMLMIFELTANAQAVPPLMVACGLAAFTVNRVLGGSIYTRAQQRTKSGTAILAA